jgi:hypothetical protein
MRLLSLLDVRLIFHDFAFFICCWPASRGGERGEEARQSIFLHLHFLGHRRSSSFSAAGTGVGADKLINYSVQSAKN